MSVVSTRARARRIATGFGLVLAGGLALGGCTSAPIGSGEGQGAADGGAAKIGVSGMFLTDPFQVVMMDQIAAAGAAAGVDMPPATNADGDSAKQITDIQNLITQNVEGLIVAPLDKDAIIPAIEQANAADIPVVTVDMGANGGEVYMIVRADNYAMGESGCEAMAGELGGRGTILNLQGDLASTNGLDRSDGFTDCIEANYPDIEVISRPTDWKAEEAVTAAQTVVSTTEIDGIFLASDSVMADGVQKVLENLGKWAPAGEDGHIVIASIDGTPLSLDLVRSGHFDAVISQPVDMYSKYAVQYVLDALDGKTYTPGPTEHGSEIVEIDGILSDNLPSPTVTKENVEDGALWGNNA
ncbi:sugar ABC transporter substrate-binding protein [Leucobacter weissii]|uniref:Sugar ABC transporter substrate-binding protein n=1 Tax=Leucobacter weissii TaxID=1983706 RepID=A0A939S5N8_9MICO|nr:sugar ABC transporter substrate-binding protein [Leucobacter weissii]MBO1901524.1 sugar ABC transporter substrate-binding protein [Leucobacter weissii]